MSVNACQCLSVAVNVCDCLSPSCKEIRQLFFSLVFGCDAVVATATANSAEQITHVVMLCASVDDASLSI